jgi:hypothetical protein
MPEHKAIIHYRLTEHAKDELAWRQISEDVVAQVLAAPEQTQDLRPGRVVYQARREMGDPPKQYLLRVFVDTDREPPDVVTVYRTSKIAKYWRADQ